MSNPSKFYLRHMNTQTRYRATWDPTKKLVIGYIGKLDNGVFSIYSSLEKEGIPAEVAIDESGAAMDYTSHDSVNITTKLAGSAPVAGSALSNLDAGFSLEFKGDNSIVFQTSNHKVHQLVNLASIEQAVLGKYNDGSWDKNWLIVTELVEADSATIIISNSSNGVLDLKASADAGAANFSLANAALGLSVVREKGSTLKYITQSGLTPLYRVMGIRHPFFGDPSLSTKGEFAASSRADLFRIQAFDERELEE